jgi:membrane protein YqaA with SNARE-associated domain
MLGRFVTSVRRLAARFIQRLRAWAESGWAGPATATWSLAQGAVVPGPTDALLVPLGLADPPGALRLAAWAIAGATGGGTIAYALGATAFHSAARPMLAFIGVGEAELDAVGSLVQKYGWLMVFGGAFLPIASTKVICILSGAFAVPFHLFLPALAAGRTIRLGGMGLLIRFAGARVTAWLNRRRSASPSAG